MGFFEEFKKFVLRGNMADLAVAVVLGGALGAVTNSFVTNIVTPPFGLLLGKINFTDLAIPLGGTVKILYGLFIQSFLNFIVVLFALFLFIRFINRLQDVALRKQQQDAALAAQPADSPELCVLKEIRDELREREAGKRP